MTATSAGSGQLRFLRATCVLLLLWATIQPTFLRGSRSSSSSSYSYTVQYVSQAAEDIQPCVQQRRHPQAVGNKWGHEEARKPPRPADHLTQALFRAVHRNPGLLHQLEVARAFLPTPWLLPEDSVTNAMLNYRALHNDLDALLAARSQQIGNYSKTVSTVYFSHHHSLLLQNWVYTAVKWAGISNYIVVTWDDQSLRACQGLNLPCLNATAYMPTPVTADGESHFFQGDFVAITWIKPLLARALLERGYLVHVSDVDIAFPPKAFWPTALHFLEPAGADIAMERDYFGPINAGSMVMRPSARTLAWINKWAESAQEDVQAKISSQQELARLGPDAYRTCDGPWDCLKLREELDQQEAAGQGAEAQVAPALIRRYLGAWDAVYQDHCTGAHLDWASPIDPCIPSHWHYHVLCATGSANKAAALKATGLWFVDDEATSGCTESPLKEDGAGEDGNEDAWWDATGQSGRDGSGAAVPAPGLQAGAVVAGTTRQLKSTPDVLTPGAASSGDRLRGRPGSAQQAQLTEGSAGRRLLEVGSERGSATDAAAAATAPQAVARCKPMHWRLPKQESAFLKCDKKQLAFVYYPRYDD